MKLMVVDADYNFNKLNEPVIRLFGKIVGTENEGEDVVLHVLGMEPYFYVDNAGLDIFELQKMVERVLKGYAKRVEIAMRYKPIGYQVNKTSMLKIVLFNPKATPEARELLKKNIPEMTNSSLYEADIVFANRFLIDAGISGMDIIEVNAQKIPNYGINIGNDSVYICKMEDIRVLKGDVVKIEY